MDVLEANIHFNTAGAVDYRSDDHQTSRPRSRGLIMNEQLMDQNTNRSITTSELRHIRKGIENGTIDPNDINFYNEY